jgi:hypothetical protein
MKFEIPEPCSERWEAMERRSDGRFCGKCQHTVIDLSRMTQRDAKRRLSQVKADYVCVQLAVDEGEAVFRPEPKRMAQWAGGLVIAAALSAGCSSSEESPIAVTEPCSVQPMDPLPPEAVLVNAPVAAPSEVIVAQGGPRVPSQEQLELTADKHRPAPVMMRGRMPMRRH